MPDQKVFAVLGSGNGGKAFCGQIAGKGYPVRLYEPLEENDAFRVVKEKREMQLVGDVRTGGPILDITTDIAEAMKGADTVFVIVPSFAHEPIFSKMIPFLEDGLHIIIVPGNFGAFLLKKMMAERGCKAEVSISETASLPYACRTTSPCTVMIHKRKFTLKIATTPGASNSEVLEVVNDVFEGVTEYIPSGNVLETGLDNFNSVLHPLPALLNIGAIEKNPSGFRHYMDGISPLVSQKMEEMDHERLALGEACGVNLVSTLEQLKRYYGRNDAGSILEYVESDESPYKDIVGHDVRSRYITEDAPYLLTPYVELGQKCKVEMPLTEMCVKLASLLHDRDYFGEGRNLAKLGLADKTMEDIIASGR